VAVSDALDDPTAAYIVATRPHFESLRDVAAQLAGLLVLAASGAQSAAPDHPMLRSAEALFRESREGILRTRSTERARSYHGHLTQAADALAAALLAARTRLGRSVAPGDLDPILTPLRTGYAHLRRASNELPGFELVGFEHACCGSRVRPAHLSGAGGLPAGRPDLPDLPDLPSGPNL
jgi:hypothetical protein